MNKRQMRTYDKEFKLNAVNLYVSNDKSYGEISAELGIPSSTLIGWVHDHKKAGKEAFVGKGHIKAENMELVHLRKELSIIREERDILKKALGIFSSARK